MFRSPLYLVVDGAKYSKVALCCVTIFMQKTTENRCFADRPQQSDVLVSTTDKRDDVVLSVLRPSRRDFQATLFRQLDVALAMVMF